MSSPPQYRTQQVRSPTEISLPQLWSYEMDDDEEINTFLEGIHQCKVLRDFEMREIGKYADRGDPDDHLLNYNASMSITRAIPALKCKAFPLTLEESAFRRERGRSHERENNHKEEIPKGDQPPPTAQKTLIREIDTIIGGPHPGGSSNNSQKKYIREAKEPANVNCHLYTCPVGIRSNEPITFILFDAVGVYFSHNDALVVQTVVARNGLVRMLVDDRSSVNIIYGTIYDKMDIDTPLIPAADPIYGFTGDSIIPEELSS
ncbi:Uncharacterized protein Adt_39423 [Abeliophyllum distichum]|uniref:Uncharacterized protein n=1 Tax=Abeliophyllum distichum TaxID=126358 RepID=A0ABD1Q510_9LAMI